MKINIYPLLCPVGDGSVYLSCLPCFKPFLTLSFCWTCCTCWSQAWSHCSFHRRALLPPLQIPMTYPELKISPLCFMYQHGNHAPSIFQKSNEKSQPLQPQPLLHFTVMDKGGKQRHSSQQSVQNVFSTLLGKFSLESPGRWNVLKSSTQGAWGP